MMEDLETHFSDFKALINAYTENCKRNRELCEVVKILRRELEYSRETGKSIQDLQCFYKKSDKNESLTVMYNKLKDKQDDVNRRNKLLEQHIVDLENKYLLEKNDLINDYKCQIQVYENKLHEQQKDFEQKESQINNAYQVYQASADLQVDDIESKWQNLLADANQKLKDSNNSCNTLRSQIVALNNKIFSNNNEAEKHIQELENKLIFTENQLRLTQEKLLEKERKPIPRFGSAKVSYYSHSKPSSYKIRRDATIVTSSRNDEESKYSPLSATNSSVGQKNVVNNIQNYEDVSVDNVPHKINQNNEIPSLKPLSNKNTKSNANKKRKLYNPNDVQYQNFNELEN